MLTSLGENTFIITKYLFLKVVPFPRILRISAEEQSSHTHRFMVSASSLFMLKLIFSLPNFMRLACVHAKCKGFFFV